MLGVHPAARHILLPVILASTRDATLGIRSAAIQAVGRVVGVGTSPSGVDGVENAVLRHGKSIIDMQFLQERMANAAIDIFMATAVLSRTTWEIEKAGSEDAAKAQVDCARIFVPMAYRRARRNIRGLRRNQAVRLKAIAEQSLEASDLGPELV